MLISERIPDANDLLALEPEELAGVLLEALLPAVRATRDPGVINRKNRFNAPELVQGYPPTQHQEIKRALMEAWVWLEREGCLAPTPDDHGSSEWFFITRRGERLANAANVAAYQRANLLPKALVHPVLAQRVYGAFLRGDYDIAIFQALKEVEVAVRTAGGFAVTDLGTDLMRKAFHEITGPLTNKVAPVAERQALSNLFAGAIGYYKNPQSHRTAPIDATEAVEVIMLASRLLRIVDTRSSQATT